MKPWIIVVCVVFSGSLSLGVILASGSGLLLDKASTATVVSSVMSGNWSDPAVWSTGTVPLAGDSVTINPGHTVTYDVAADVVLGHINIDGILRFSRTADTRLRTNDNILVRWGGILDMGTSNDFIPRSVKAEIIWVLTQAQANAFVGGAAFEPSDKGLWAMPGSRWDAHGFPLVRTWSKLAMDASPGASTVSTENDVTDWGVGDTVVISSTRNPVSYHIREDGKEMKATGDTQNELRTIQSLESLGNGQTKITLDRPLLYQHSGTYPYKGEVALLTRNVLFKTELLGTAESSFVDDVRTRNFAHTIYMAGARGDLQYAEFKYMGHYGKLARYANHHHLMQETSKGMVVRGTSGWYSGFRCVNLHATHGVLVEDNTCFSSSSTSYFVEMSPVVNGGVGDNVDNAFVHNIAIGMMPKHFDDRNDKSVFGDRPGRTAVDYWPSTNNLELSYQLSSR